MSYFDIIEQRLHGGGTLGCIIIMYLQDLEEPASTRLVSIVTAFRTDCIYLFTDRSSHGKKLTSFK